MKHCYCPWVMVWLLCLLLGNAHALDVVLVHSDRNPAYAQASALLVDELLRRGVARTEINVQTLSEWKQGRPESANAKVWVAVGTDAFSALVPLSNRPTLVASMLPRLAYERTLREWGGRASGITAVYFDQPPSRVLATARIAYPESKRVGVLWGNESVLLDNAFQTAAHEQGFVLRSTQVSASSQIFAGLQSVLEDIQVLVALADPLIYNANTIGNILLTSYRAGVPVLAFSPAYVKAGALIGLYSTPTQLTPQTASQVMRVLTNGVVPLPQYPQDFTVEVNDYVARSLGVSFTGAVLLQRIKQMEGAKP